VTKTKKYCDISNNFFHKINNIKGFTLVELLVVISIISLLSSIVLTSINEAREKARIAAGKTFSTYLDRNLGFYTVGSWSFEETSGDVLDNSGKEQTGYILGSVDRVTDCDLELGNCVYFDGSDSMIRTVNDPNNLFTDGVILAAWIKPDAINGRRSIVSRNFHNEQMYSFEILDGRFYFYSWICGSQTTTRLYIDSGIDVVKVGEWQHVALSIEELASLDYKLKFFHNGKMIYETVNTDLDICPGTSITTSLGMQIGANRSSGGAISREFLGHMDEVRQILISIDGLSIKEIVGELYAIRN